MLVKTLVNVSTHSEGASGGTHTSDAFLIEGVFDAESLAFFLYASKKAGTSPTLDVKIQTSPDNSNWVDTGVTFTQVTTSTASTEVKMLSTNGLCPYIRAVCTIGGTGTPSYSMKVMASAIGRGEWGG